MASSQRGLIRFRELSRRLRTPEGVQRFLRERFSYNFEESGETLRSAAGTLRARRAHCLEASLVAAAVLEHRGYPPLVLSLESADDLDHVVFVFLEKTGWGAIGRSREPGLHGRQPVFRSIRDLALSYFDPFVDRTGALIGYGMAALDDSGSDWRFSPRNVWRVERFLIEVRHQRLKKTPRYQERCRRLHELYLERGPIQSGQHWW